MSETPEALCGRPSMYGRVAGGASSWTSVDLVVVGGVGHQSLAIRAGLEEMAVRVNLFRVVGRDPSAPCSTPTQ